MSVENTAALDVLTERCRQIKAEGWTPEHDDEHCAGEMAEAAALYIMHGTRLQGSYHDLGDGGESRRWPADWPWAPVWWKPKDRRRNLVRAAALLLAEIERLDRRAALSPSANASEGGK